MANKHFTNWATCRAPRWSEGYTHLDIDEFLFIKALNLSWYLKIATCLLSEVVRLTGKVSLKTYIFIIILIIKFKSRANVTVPESKKGQIPWRLCWQRHRWHISLYYSGILAWHNCRPRDYDGTQAWDGICTILGTGYRTEKHLRTSDGYGRLFRTWGTHLYYTAVKISPGSAMKIWTWIAKCWFLKHSNRQNHRKINGKYANYMLRKCASLKWNDWTCLQRVILA